MLTEDEAFACFLAAIQGTNSDESRQKGAEFQPRPGDVIIATPPKCGTTMVQQIVHTLRTGGADYDDIDEISLAVPCLEMAHDYGYSDLQADQPGAFRAYKTHFTREQCPHGEGVKYIIVVRDPAEAVTSFYHFMEGWCFAQGAFGVDRFVRDFIIQRGQANELMARGSLWHDMASWYPVHRDSHVLWLHYEDLVQDRAAGIQLIASFLGIALTPELQTTALEQSSLEFMARHRSKYDEHHLKQRRNAACGLDKSAGLQGNEGKVRTSPKAKSSASSLQLLQQKWMQVMQPVCGHKSYSDMRKAINAELSR